MPLGFQLKQLIGLSLHVPSMDDQLHGALFGNQHVEHVARTLRSIVDALPLALSIDNLVEHRGDDAELVRCAKISIAHAILLSERKSLLAIRDGRAPDVSKVDGSAIFSLFQSICAGATKRSLRDAFTNVVFINFNYDRCLEHFLYHAILRYSGEDRDFALSIIKDIPIFHPYGVVGLLPWQANRGGSPVANFGENLGWVELGQVADQIKTFSEEMADDVEIDILKSYIKVSDQIIFLGNAFHQQNMRLIKPDEQGVARRVYGTCYKIPPADPSDKITPDAFQYAIPDSLIFANEMSDWFDVNDIDPPFFAIEPLTCRQLVSKYENTWLR